MIRAHSALRLSAVSALLLASTALAVDTPLPTTFTYQGRLMDNGDVAQGLFNLQFRLFDQQFNGIQIGNTIVKNNTAINEGLLTTELDFDAEDFNGSERWLQITVNGITLSPRQEITPAPYAMQLRGVHVAEDGFVGIGRTDKVTANEVFGISSDTTGYGGMYIETSGASSDPFYGYSTVGGATCWTYFEGASDDWRVYNNGDRLTVKNDGDVILGDGTGFVGVGREDQASGAEVFGIQANTTGYGGMYIRTSGATGDPFYGYANEGSVATCWTYYEGGTDDWRVYNNGDRLTVKDNGFVGVGRSDAVTPAEVFGIQADTTGYGGMYIQSSDINGDPFYGYANEGGGSCWTYYEGGSDEWRVYNAGDRLRIQTDGDMYLCPTGGELAIGAGAVPSFPITMASGAFCSFGGTWVNASSRDLKENFAAVDTTDILEKVSSLDLSEWNYIEEDDAVRHLGPIAEEFAETFGLGNTDVAISTVDASGVALAAIQGLHAQVQQRDATIAELLERLQAVEALVDQLDVNSGGAR